MKRMTMMTDRFIFFNPNREGKLVGDCVIRSLCAVLQLDWDEIFLRLSMLAFEMSDMMDSNIVWGRFLNLYGYIQMSVIDKGVGPYTVYDFCMDHPRGKYILGTGIHAIAVIDGFYYDTSDTGNERIIFYYEKGRYV